MRKAFCLYPSYMFTKLSFNFRILKNRLTLKLTQSEPEFSDVDLRRFLFVLFFMNLCLIFSFFRQNQNEKPNKWDIISSSCAEMQIETAKTRNPTTHTLIIELLLWWNELNHIALKWRSQSEAINRDKFNFVSFYFLFFLRIDHIRVFPYFVRKDFYRHFWVGVSITERTKFKM